jgi:hypothetical protein
MPRILEAFLTFLIMWLFYVSILEEVSKAVFKYEAKIIKVLFENKVIARIL